MHKRILPLLFLFFLPCRVADAQWVKLNTPTNTNLVSFATNDTFLFIGATGGIVLRSNDSGQTFLSGNSVYTSPPLDNGIRSLAYFRKKLFANASGQMFCSFDNGNDWTANLNDWAKNISDTIINPFTLIGSGNNLFAKFSFRRGIGRSTDNGNTWDSIPNGYLLGILGAFDSILYAEGNDTTYRFDANTKVWSLSNSGLKNIVFDHFASTGSTLFISAGEDGIFRSTDHGDSWTQSGFNSKLWVSSLTAFGNIIFAGTSSAGIFFSTDEGLNWLPANSGLQNSDLKVEGVIVYGKYLFLMTYNNLWRRPLSETITSSVSSSNQPSAFHLKQNYPNPFSESTTITFNIPERTFVSLKVYDITGREVAVLANETLGAGSFTRNFNAEALPNGTYICRMEAGAFRQALTLQVVR